VGLRVGLRVGVRVGARGGVPCTRPSSPSRTLSIHIRSTPAAIEPTPTSPNSLAECPRNHGAVSRVLEPIGRTSTPWTRARRSGRDVWRTARRMSADSNPALGTVADCRVRVPIADCRARVPRARVRRSALHQIQLASRTLSIHIRSTPAAIEPTPTSPGSLAECPRNHGAISWVLEPSGRTSTPWTRARRSGRDWWRTACRMSADSNPALRTVAEG